MSKFNEYGRRADTIAREAFKAYQEAEQRCQKAEAEAREYPQRGGMVPVEYAAKSARAAANLAEAKEALQNAKNKLQSRKEDIQGIRKELASALNSHYAADPSKLDSNTITLLASGILKPAEYARLMNQAKADGNTTMCRLISKYATSAADADVKENGRDSDTARELRAVSYMVNVNTGADELARFDVIQEVYNRSADNPAMIEAWDSLTTNAIENL